MIHPAESSQSVYMQIVLAFSSFFSLYIGAVKRNRLHQGALPMKFEKLNERTNLRGEQKRIGNQEKGREGGGREKPQMSRLI